MTRHMLGEISLNISTIIYFIWFIPQLWLTFKRKATSGLSFWMHGLLVLGYTADLMYGFGRHMQWQYRLVTVCGLGYLAIEHYQFWHYGMHRVSQRINFQIFNVLWLGLLGFSLYNIILVERSRYFYDFAGLVSSICWFSFFLPQIIKNFVNRSAQGISVSFVVLSILSGICDVISAFALNWDWPSKMSAPIGLVKKSVLFAQLMYYRGKQHNEKAINR